MAISIQFWQTISKNRPNSADLAFLKDITQPRFEHSLSFPSDILGVVELWVDVSVRISLSLFLHLNLSLSLSLSILISSLYSRNFYLSLTILSHTVSLFSCISHTQTLEHTYSTFSLIPLSHSIFVPHAPHRRFV